MIATVSGRAARFRQWIAGLSKVDLAIALAFAVITFAAAYRVADWDMAQYTRATARDIWFDADVNRVYAGETDRQGGTDRTTLHPLYGYLTYPPLFVFRKVTGVSAYTTVRIFHSAVAGLFLASFYGVMLCLRLRRLDAAAFTAAMGTSAAAVFWFPATETFTLGGLTLLPAVALAARPPTARELPHFLANTFSLGVTVTNWLCGLLISWIDLSRRAFLRAAGGALAVGLVFGYAYRWVFPESLTLFNGTLNEAAWIFAPEAGGPWAVTRAFFFNGIVAPEQTMVTNFRQPAWPLLSMQFGRLFSGTGWTYLATPAWIALLAAGGVCLVRMKEFPRLRTVLGVTLLYQLLLHLVYGRETFLYAMHYVPLLFVVAALGCHTRLRPVIVGLALTLTVANAANNSRQFSWARAYAHRHGVISAQEDEIRRLIRVPRPRLDPSYRYRFWRDGWSRPSAPH